MPALVIKTMNELYIKDEPRPRMKLGHDRADRDDLPDGPNEQDLAEIVQIPEGRDSPTAPLGHIDYGVTLEEHGVPPEEYGVPDPYDHLEELGAHIVDVVKNRSTYRRGSLRAGYF